MMKESAAWRRIAFLLDAWSGDREGFLCCRVDELYFDDGVIDVMTKCDMKARIERNLEHPWSSSAYREEHEGGEAGHVNRKARVMAALWFAEEAEGEEQEALDEEGVFV